MSSFLSLFVDQDAEAKRSPVPHSWPHSFVDWKSSIGFKSSLSVGWPHSNATQVISLDVCTLNLTLSHVKHVYWFKLIIILVTGKEKLNRRISILCLKRTMLLISQTLPNTVIWHLDSQSVAWCQRHPGEPYRNADDYVPSYTCWPRICIWTKFPRDS